MQRFSHDRTAEQLSYESLRNMEGAGVSAGNKRENERGMKRSWRTQLQHADPGPVCSQTLSLTFLQDHSKGPAIVFFLLVQCVCSLPKRKHPGSFPERSRAMLAWAPLFGNVKFAVKGNLEAPVGKSATSGNVSEFWAAGISLSASAKHRSHSVFPAADGGVSL